MKNILHMSGELMDITIDRYLVPESYPTSVHVFEDGNFYGVIAWQGFADRIGRMIDTVEHDGSKLPVYARLDEYSSAKLVGTLDRIEISELSHGAVVIGYGKIDSELAPEFRAGVYSCGISLKDSVNISFGD